MSEHYPDELRYTAEHEWVATTDSPDVVRFGITYYAQDSLGDIVFVTLPQVGDEVTAGQPCGEVESTKSVSDIYAPVTGTVVARNDAAETSPEVLNSDPYTAGWLAEVRVADPAGLDAVLSAPSMLTAADYRTTVEG